MDARSSDVWRWVAAIVVTAMLAGAPGYINVVRSPNRDDLEKLNDRQIDVLARLSVIEARLAVDDKQRDELRSLVAQAQRDLAGHILAGDP